MKTKKAKPCKDGSRRRKALSDVTPSTSLPPLVEGQLRCFLRVTVSRIIWTVSKPPMSPTVRLRWWGESSAGTLFRPRDGNRVEPGVKTTARFAIRCGPKQFTSYLTDMGTLVLEVLSKPDHLPIGRVQIPNLARLSLSNPISGFFTVVSPVSEKLGELQVSLALESLTETYDSSSSVPTTDMSVDSPCPALGSTSKPVSHSDHIVIPPVSHHPSASSGKESRPSSSACTPIGKDHLYFQERNGTREEPSEITSKEPLRSLGPSSRWSPNGGEDMNLGRGQGSSRRPDTDSQNSNDILSVLLDRGNKLRNAMVISALKSNPDPESVLKDIPHPVPKENIGTLPQLSSIRPTGRLLEGVLRTDPHLSCPMRSLPSPELPKEDWAPSTENRAVELLLGSLNGSSLPIWDGESPPLELLSGASSMWGDTDLEDPRYDQSLLEHLFYSGPVADVSLSDIADEEEGPSVRKRQQKAGLSGTNEKAEKLRKHSDKKRRGLGAEESGGMLSEEQIAALGRLRVARVVVHSLKVSNESAQKVPLKIHSQGKPPRPLSSRKCTYFVEYGFPVPSKKHDDAPVTMATELTRVASCKVAEGMVNFQQQHIFPVNFNSAAIEHWWNTDLRFTIYTRKGSQNKPTPIGSAIFALRSVLQQETWSCQPKALPVLGMVGKLEKTQEKPDLGPLKVSIELGVDRKALSAPRRSKSPLSLTVPDGQTALSPDDTPGVELHSSTSGLNDISVDAAERDGRLDTPKLGVHNRAHCPAINKPTAQSEEEEGGVLLHALLMVPDGRDFSSGPAHPPNVYLSCKLFGSDEPTRSEVSWGQIHPTFSFVQVAPVALTGHLLDRLRNNVMVIEVWQRGGGSGQDHALGLVKLPLHQFYMSFREPKVSHLLLQAQYPVVGVDSYMPVLDIYSGTCRGRLRVLLAMGLAEQIASLQRMRDVELSSVPHPLRPPHMLDSGPQSGSKVEASQVEDVREHVFEVRVERVKGLMPLQSTVWGEADCYVQYSFPSQEKEAVHSLDPRSPESNVALSRFRTPATLCVPDPVFSHSRSHILMAPTGVPVQRLLLGSLSGQGADTRGGVVFEVWCRYYYPNVRDQLAASGLLPLSKLCAMVTMQREEVSDAQVFSLPLVPRTESSSNHQPRPSGLMDVYVHYLHRPMRAEGAKVGVGLEVVASRVVMLAVQVHRAAGLQAAARATARLEDSFRYYADVGVNSYVTAELSFLPERERRSTRVVARSFCPEFEHHAEFACSLVARRADGETRSLAELLDGAAAVFTLLHRDGRRHAMEGPAARDTVLGTVTVQLADLVHRRTGISGWFALSLPSDAQGLHANHGAVGGLELSVNFAHRADRQRMIDAARELGWHVDEEEVEEDEAADEGEGWRECPPTVSVVVSVPRAWLPVHCLQLPGQAGIQRSTYCYVRYKLYDGKAICSSLQHPALEGGAVGARGDTVATAAFGAGKPMELRLSQALRWYLREERLEIQLWVAFGKHKTPRPHNSDRLVGSAYVDLSSLASRGQQKLNITGVYPLFRRSCPDLSGAALRVHVCTTAPRQIMPENEEDGDDVPGSQEEDEEEGGEKDVAPAEAVVAKGRPPQVVERSEVPPSEAVLGVKDTFTVRIAVERAVHLSLKGSPLVEHSGASPSCCVSYSTADPSSPVTTPVVQDSSCPVWNHQHESRLSKQILMDPQQTLVFKVWHKGDVERVIGFASVDLSPLLAGFQVVCGWYNITDFSGQCQGQLKVSVSPLEALQDLRGQRHLVEEEMVKDSVAPFQPLYCTSGVYNGFPAHISCYPEQRITASPNHMEVIFSGRSSVDDRHEEHVANVRMFHQSLKDSKEVPHSTVSEENHPSSATLFSALRKNLSELDDIQKYFSRKLSTPTFTSQSERDWRPRMAEHEDSEADSTSLLLKSNHLVGEVNNLISGLHGSSPQGSGHVSEEAELTEEQPLCTGRGETPLPSHHLGAPESLQDGRSPSSSPAPDSDGPDRSLFMAEKDHNSEDGVRSGSIEGEVEELEEEVEELDEEYEETVIEPRPLNEITSLTDKTSPWTSLLDDDRSDSDESLGAAGAQDWPQEGRGVTSQREDLEPSVQQDEEDNCGLRVCAEEEPSNETVEETVQSAAGPEGEPVAGSEGGTVKRPEDQDDNPEEDVPSLHSSESLRDLTDTCHSEGSAKEAQLPDSLEIPNFFLPAHQLEASMRALRLAPVFSTVARDAAERPAQLGIPSQRAPRLRPNMSSVKEEETKRIAKIFATTFSNTK